MMNIHGQGHDQSSIHLPVFAPGDHRRKEFAFIENVDIKVFYRTQGRQETSKKFGG